MKLLKKIGLICIVIYFLFFIQINTVNDNFHKIDCEKKENISSINKNTNNIPYNFEIKNTVNEDVVVFITKTGRRYHLESCGSLHSSKIKSTVKKAKNRGLTPCNNCNPPQ